ncbi:hypothetical protein AVEN_54029-1 [Araneus ventricosus]|uniref:Uncharacterized protein n=1 Tax=Araneus ventricosus TaxID=182803 RepID=A0A4Y2NAL7_ARAVE|nr:hypothetical protein AVEN_54029-1 [Araneus ventricosus]
MTGSSHVWTPDLGDFSDEIWDLKGAGIFSISLLVERLDDGGNVDRLVSPWSASVFGVLSAVRASCRRSNDEEEKMEYQGLLDSFPDGSKAGEKRKRGVELLAEFR